MFNTIKLSALCGAETQEQDCTRFEYCPFCGELDCFCVYRGHAYCHNEQKSYTKEQVLTWLHRKAPCTVTLNYSEDVREMPEQLRCKAKEFIVPEFGYPVFGYTAEDNEPYVLCYDRDKNLRRIVWARPHKDWITLYDSYRLELDDRPKSIIIFRSLSQALRAEKLAYEAWQEQSRQILFTALPPEPDAEVLCNLADLSGCTVYVAEADISQVFINKLYAAGAKAVYRDTSEKTPYLWDANDIYKMLNWGELELLKQDKRVSEKKAMQNVIKQNFARTFVSAFGAKRMGIGDDTCFLFAPNDYKVSSACVTSPYLREMVGTELAANGIRATNKQIDSTISEIVSCTSRVEPYTQGIGERLMFYDKKIYINASPDEIIQVSDEAIDFFPQNSLNGIYFGELHHENFDITETERSVREIMVDVFGHQWDYCVSPIIGPYMAILPFLAASPHPILMFDAPEGRGKTFAAAIIRNVLDPQKDVFSSPFITSKPLDIMCAISDKCVAIIDNITSINSTNSNLLCQAATNNSVDFRILMTNNDTDKSTANSLIIITSICPQVANTDLMSRMCVVDFPKLKRRHRYSDIKRFIPELRFALLKVMQTILQNFNTIMSEETKSRFIDFDILFKYAIEYCGWDNKLYAKHILKQKNLATQTLLGSNKVMDFLINDIELGKKYPSRNLYDMIVQKTGVDMTFIGMMRMINSFGDALERAGYKLEKELVNKVPHYTLERI